MTTERPEEHARLPAAGDALSDADRAIDRLLDAPDRGPAMLADLATALARRFWLVVDRLDETDQAEPEEEREADDRDGHGDGDDGDGEGDAERDLAAALETLAEAVAPASTKDRLQAATLLGRPPGDVRPDETAAGGATSGPTAPGPAGAGGARSGGVASGGGASGGGASGDGASGDGEATGGEVGGGEVGGREPGGAGAEEARAVAVGLFSSAAARQDPDPGAAAVLGLVLAERHERHGLDADRDEAIVWLRRAHDVVVRMDAELAPHHFLLSGLLLGRADERRDAVDVTAAIGYAQRCATAVDDDDPDRVVVLHRLGLAHLLRAEILGGDARDDLAAAATHFSAVLAALPHDHPGYGEAATCQGIALGLWTRVDLRTFPYTHHALHERAGEAVRLLADGTARLPETDPLRAVARFQLAMTRAVGGFMLDSDAGERAAALDLLGEVLGEPDRPVAQTDVCHVLSAALMLAEWIPDDVRHGAAQNSLETFGRNLYGPHARLPREAADAAAAHLDQVSDETAADLEYSGLAHWLRTFLVIATDPAALTDEGVSQVAARLTEDIAALPDGDLERHETQGMLGLMHALRSAASGDEERLRHAAGLVAEAGRGLPEGHPMRSPLLSMLGGVAGVPFGDGRGSQEELDAAVAALEYTLENTPDEDPARPEILTRLAKVLVRGLRYARPSARFGRVGVLLTEAVERSADPLNRAVNLALLGAAEGFGATYDATSGVDLDRQAVGIERLKEAAELVPRHDAIQVVISGALVSLLGMRFMITGELEAVDAAVHHAKRLVEDGGDPAAANALLTIEYFAALAPIARSKGMLGGDELEAAAAAQQEIARRLPESHPLRDSVDSDRALMDLLRGTNGLDLDTLRSRPDLFAAYTDAVSAEVANTGEDEVLHHLGRLAEAQAKVGQGLVRRDLRLMDEGVALLADACEGPDIHPWRRYQLVAAHGMALQARYDVARDRNDLLSAVTRLEQARRAAGQETTGAPLADLLYSLALGYHQRDDSHLGDRRNAAETGLAAMREVAGDVILQSDAARALDAAAEAAGDGLDVARWCLHGGYAESAVEALELGRATVLHAATAEANVPALLRDGGHEGLAAEWEDALADGVIRPWDEAAAAFAPAAHVRPQGALEVPSDLRHRVMRAIEGTETERRLVAPPGVPEIAGSLDAAGVDALVYLLPRDEQNAGLALVLGTDGAVRDLPLPRLSADEGGLVRAFASEDRPGEAVLAPLCDWAWTAAMETVLPAVAAGLDHRPRIVLVPVGELGAVPWHAARRRVAGGVWRYACQDAVISYAASARQFADARRLPARPWNSAPALVRVGESGLIYATQEIMEIHRRHYSHGVLLGGRRRGGVPSKKATAEHVRAQLPGADSPGASLLHLGCHALAAVRPVDSRLLLADEEILAMTGILRQARERPKDAAGGLVVLAACGSDRTSDHHDEALTLATAFLAAGACGVIGARWPVADVPTALLMIMFHHYLNAGYEDPATALRAAQLWMLDPRRRPPPGLDPRLAEEMRCVDLAAIDAWAAFTYQGQ